MKEGLLHNSSDKLPDKIYLLSQTALQLWQLRERVLVNWAQAEGFRKGFDFLDSYTAPSIFFRS